jgi:dipeptidyl aminopeptidase/acylaminoacyl peptidase
MGEVFRAKDTRLGRDVALKVLPEAFAKDADRLRRFEQEAKTVAALNHPNILGLHDIGTHDGRPYLVSELLEGETLREKVEAGALPVKRVIDYAQGIAQGLAAAHDKGVVHRDLKPGNIFITRDERVKVLDFGLAKLVRPDENPQNAMTMTSPTTMPGVVMGTVGYMSPEQVRGETSDARSDIFSFGAVLFEMLTGKRAFKRNTSVETMTAILREEPRELAETGWQGPVGLQRILGRCLEKRPERRFQSASDLGFAIEALSGSSSGIGSQVHAVVSVKGSWWQWAAGLATLVLLMAGAWMVGKSSRAKPNLKIMRLTYQEGYTSVGRFAKDGETVVYSARWANDPMQIYTVRTNYPQSVKVELPSAALLALSASGDMQIALEPQFHANFVSGVMAKTRIEGGTPRRLEDNIIAADFAPDGNSLAVVRRTGGTVVLEYPQGKTVYETSGYLDYVRVGPGGAEVAFVEHPVYDDDRGWVSIVDAAGKHQRLTGEYAGIQGIAWSRGGKEIWFTAGNAGSDMQLFGVDRKAKVRQVTAMAQRTRLLDIAGNGRVLFSGEDYREEIVGLDPVTGKERSGLEWFNGSTLADISPDRNAILLEEWGGATGPLYEVAYRKLDGTAPVALGPGSGPVFSPDGKTVAAVLLTQPPEIALYPVGPGVSRKLPTGDVVNVDLAYWFPDGKRLMLVGAKKGEALRTFEMDLDGGKPEPLGPPDWQGAAVSRDGKRIAGQKSTGEKAIYDTDTKSLQVISSIDPDEDIQRWTADGRGILICQGTVEGAKVSRVEFPTGKRTLVHEVKLTRKAGSVSKVKLMATEDGKVYVYRVRRDAGTLYVAEGLD